jgi:hypothetical protein
LKNSTKWRSFGTSRFEDAAIGMARLFNADEVPLDVVVRDTDTGVERELKVSTQARYVIEGLNGDEDPPK